MHFRFVLRIFICLYIHNIESLIVFGFVFCVFSFRFCFTVFVYYFTVLPSCFAVSACSLNRNYVYIIKHSHARFILLLVAIISVCALCEYHGTHTHTYSSYTSMCVCVGLHNQWYFLFTALFMYLYFMWYLFKIMHSFLLCF